MRLWHDGDSRDERSRPARSSGREAHAPVPARGRSSACPTLPRRFVERRAARRRSAAALAIGRRRRRRARCGAQRHALALAVALGDLARRAAARSGDRDALRLRRPGDRRGAARRDRSSACPDAEPRGFAVLALGKLGSRELNYSSDVDLILLFDPATLPRRPRDDAGEAAVRIGRRLVELLQQRTADGYVARVDLRLRPSPEVTPIVLPVDAAISYYESSALPWERAAFIRARAGGRRYRARASASSTRSSRSSGAARSISARSTRSATSRCGSATIMRRARRSARASTSSAAAAASARSNSSPRSSS